MLRVIQMTKPRSLFLCTPRRTMKRKTILMAKEKKKAKMPRTKKWIDLRCTTALTLECAVASRTISITSAVWYVIRHGLLSRN